MTVRHSFIICTLGHYCWKFNITDTQCITHAVLHVKSHTAKILSNCFLSSAITTWAVQLLAIWQQASVVEMCRWNSDNHTYREHMYTHTTHIMAVIMTVTQWTSAKPNTQALWVRNSTPCTMSLSKMCEYYKFISCYTYSVWMIVICFPKYLLIWC